ncbi:MAG: DUF5657 family protein [Patescibacteria group bacterium]
MDVATLTFVILKWLVVFGLAMYCLFAVVIIRQEQLMANVLEETFEPVLRLAAIIHLVASIAIFFAAILLL